MPERWLDHFYVSFLGRDLAYISAGALFLAAVERAFLVGRQVSLVPIEFGWPVAYFVAASYVLGLLVKEYFGWQLGIPRVESGDQGNHLVAWERIVRHYSSLTLIQHERTVFLMHLGLSIGGACVLSGIVLLIGANFKSDDVGLIFVFGLGLLLVGAALLSYGCKKSHQAQNELDGLVAGRTT